MLLFLVFFHFFKVLRSFLDAFDTPGNEDGVVTKQEFYNYYSIVSATISDDSYFDLIIRKCYELPLEWFLEKRVNKKYIL